jgi:hypothetical protein
MAVAWLEQHHRTFRGTAPMGNAPAGENGQRTALSTPNNAICNGHPRDAAGEDLSRRYYARELRSLSAAASSPSAKPGSRSAASAGPRSGAA